MSVRDASRTDPYVVETLPQHCYCAAQQAGVHIRRDHGPCAPPRLKSSQWRMAHSTQVAAGTVVDVHDWEQICKRGTEWAGWIEYDTKAPSVPRWPRGQLCSHSTRCLPARASHGRPRSRRQYERSPPADQNRARLVLTCRLHHARAVTRVAWCKNRAQRREIVTAPTLRGPRRSQSTLRPQLEIRHRLIADANPSEQT